MIVVSESRGEMSWAQCRSGRELFKSFYHSVVGGLVGGGLLSVSPSLFLTESRLLLGRPSCPVQPTCFGQNECTPGVEVMY